MKGVAMKSTKGRTTLATCDADAKCSATRSWKHKRDAGGRGRWVHTLPADLMCTQRENHSSQRSSTFFFRGVLCHICPRSELDFPAIQAGDSVRELCDKARPWHVTLVLFTLQQNSVRTLE